jgi:hypothetical protein
MSSIIYYSTHCDKSKAVLTALSKSQVSNEIHFLCIDKRVKSGTGAWHIVTETGEKVLLPPQVNRVPALLLLNKGHMVLYGEQILQHFQPKNVALNNEATGFNGEPNAFALGRESMGSGFGVASDNYSFLDQSADELSAKGNGGMRQLYNYATIDTVDKIETPPDNYSPDKVGSVSLEKLQQQRNSDIQQPNANNHIVGGVPPPYDGGAMGGARGGAMGGGSGMMGGGGAMGGGYGGGGAMGGGGMGGGYGGGGAMGGGAMGGGGMGGGGGGGMPSGSQRGQSMPTPQQFAPVGTPPQFAAQAVYRAPPQQPEYSRLGSGGAGGAGGGGLRGTMDTRPQPRGGGSWI